MDGNKIQWSVEFPGLNSKEESRLKNSNGEKFSRARFMQACASIATTAFCCMHTAYHWVQSFMRDSGISDILGCNIQVWNVTKWGAAVIYCEGPKKIVNASTRCTALTLIISG